MHDYDFVEENLALAYYTCILECEYLLKAPPLVYTVGCGGCVSMGARGGMALMTVEEHLSWYVSREVFESIICRNDKLSFTMSGVGCLLTGNCHGCHTTPGTHANAPSTPHCID